MILKDKYTEVKMYVENLGYELINKEYKKDHDKLLLLDGQGFLYTISFSKLKQGITPPRFHKNNPFTIQNIINFLLINNKNIMLISDKYNGINKKLIFKCLNTDCNEYFEMRVQDIIHLNFGCPCCSGQKTCLSNCLATKNPELASEWHTILNGDLTPYDVTCGSGKKVWWKCDKGHEWEAIIAGRNSGINCPYCAHKLPSKEYNLYIINPELASEWDYNKNKKKPEDYCPNSGKYAWWICKECGCEWEAEIHGRNQGRGCPKCAESKGEKRTAKYFNLNNIYYISQKEFDGLIGFKGGNLSYDFYLPDFNLLIEYQGLQHEKYCKGFHKSKKDFERQVEYDRRKKEYAYNNNINLLEIWYYDFDNIEEILKRKLGIVMI